MSSRLEKSVALLGKLGHGKTRILNAVCGTYHASRGGTKSVTRTIELGISKRHGICFLGTPGLGPTEDVAQHIGAQKLALEFSPLSGVYLVIKCGRDADMIDEQIFDIIDMVGEEMIRIIVTHSDVEAQKEGYNEVELKHSIGHLAGIDVKNIIIVGLETNPQEIDDFVNETTLSQPKEIKLDPEEISKLAIRSHASRNLTRIIRDIYGKIDAAHGHCNMLTDHGSTKTYENDVVIRDIQHAVSKMVSEDKEQVFRDAVSLSADEQTICYAQVGASLSAKVKQFIERTNQYLSWNVTNLNDPRNHYRACNYCGAIYVKVEGCDGNTVCGALSATPDCPQHKMNANFSTFGINWSKVGGGRWKIITQPFTRFWGSSTTQSSLRGDNPPDMVHRKRSDALIESGCGQTIAWTSMRPVEPQVVINALGHIETIQAKPIETLSAKRFHTEIEIQEELNKETLKQSLNEFHAEGWEFVASHTKV